MDRARIRVNPTESNQSEREERWPRKIARSAKKTGDRKADTGKGSHAKSFGNRESTRMHANKGKTGGVLDQ
jgi:hypothetical protein